VNRVDENGKCRLTVEKHKALAAKRVVELARDKTPPPPPSPLKLKQ
jgi:hypothetical protein